MDRKQITLQIKAEVREAEKRLKKLINNQKKIKKQNDGLKKSFAAVGGVIASAFSIQAIARFTASSIRLGSQTISLERSFRNLGKAVNFNDESLEKFRKATDGTVSDVDLMIQANNAMLLGIVENDDQFAELIDSAQRLAKAVGQDALFGVESLTTGIGRQSKLMLDNLGIVLDTNLAYKRFAEANGKLVKDLDENERKQAFVQAAIDATKSKVNQLGKETLDASDSMTALNTQFKNLQGNIGKELQDEVEVVTGQMSALLTILNEDIEEKGLLGTLLSGRLPIGLGGIPALFDPITTAINNLPPAEEGVGDFIDRLQRIPETSPDNQLAAFSAVFGMVQKDTVAHNEAMKEIEENALNFRMGGIKAEFFVRDSFNKKVKQDVKELRQLERDAQREKIAQNLETAILQGQNAKEAGISVIKAEVAKSTASLITKIMQSVPFPLNLAVAAGAGGMIGKVTDQLFSSFATGGSFVTKGRTTLPIGNGVVVGDNASGMERIDVTPLPSPTSNGNNITINISAPLVDETVVDTIIPAIRRAEKLNL